MAINFTVGDKVIVKQDYVRNTLNRMSIDPNLKRTISLLQLFGIESAEVTGVGTIDVFDRGSALTRSYIQAVPQSMQNPNYQRGQGVILYFDNDTLLNNSFEFSTAYLCDICARRVLNTSGVNISKFDVVRYTGFDDTTQLATIALASAASLTTNAVMGIAEEDINDGEVGSVIVEGAISGVDTSAFLVNETVFLSDTPGGFQSGAATTTSVVGRVHTVGITGSISVKGELPVAAASGAQVATGTYTGDSNDNRVITTGFTSPVKGIQFSILPQAAFDSSRSYLAHWNPSMGTSIAWSASDTGHAFIPSQGTVRPNGNDFEVDDSFVNSLNAVYHWIAWA